MDLTRDGSGAGAPHSPGHDSDGHNSNGHDSAERGWMDAQATLNTIDAKASAENFPVASRLLPGRYRQHLLAVYGFARLVDDVGDEAPGNRLALLDAVDDDLDRVVGDGVPHLAVLRQLAPTVRTCHLPLDPFHRLVEANRRDQTEVHYQRYADLLDYCTLSANPVGHLVLGIFGVADPERVVLSDAVCTALQLVEHWQDVAEDAARGRIYLPAEDLRRFGCTPADLTAEETSPQLRRLMAFEVSRAQALMTRGAPLVATLSGAARLAVAGFVAGGQAALNALGAADFDVLSGPPKASRRAVAGGTLTRLLNRGRV
jgi:squalene synthase HpnC